MELGKPLLGGFKLLAVIAGLLGYGQIDLGIVLLHFSSTASQWAGKIKWSFGADAAKLQLPEGYEAVASCKL